MIPGGAKFIRNTPKLSMYGRMMGVERMTQRQFYTLMSTDELHDKIIELGVDKDRDKVLIFSAAVLAWIITGNLSDKIFGVQLSGILAGLFIIVFGRNIVGAFTLGVEQAFLETIAKLGWEEIETRTVRLDAIEKQENLSGSDRLEYWMGWTKFRRTTFQWVGLANITNWVLILSYAWVAFLITREVFDFFW